MPRLCSLKLSCAWLGLLVASASGSAESIDREWGHSGNGSVTIDNAFGRIEVIGWPESRVRLQAELGAGSTLVVGNASSSRLRFAVKHPDRSGRPASGAASDRGSRLVVHVPFGVALALTSVTADIDVSGIRGSPMVAVNTISGDQRLAFTARAARAKSVSGDIGVSGAAARTAVASISGDVVLQDFTGAADVSMVSGDLGITRSSFGVLDLESVSGDLDIDATPLRAARWTIESLGGDIDVRGVDYGRVAVTAESFSGNIDSGAQAIGVRRDRAGMGQTLQLEPPGAEARIAIDSFSGDIRLHGAR